MASGRVRPNDVEAEKAVLSALLLDNRAIHEVVTEVACVPDQQFPDQESPAHGSSPSLLEGIISIEVENAVEVIGLIGDRKSIVEANRVLFPSRLGQILGARRRTGGRRQSEQCQDENGPGYPDWGHIDVDCGTRGQLRTWVYRAPGSPRLHPFSAAHRPDLSP